MRVWGRDLRVPRENPDMKFTRGSKSISLGTGFGLIFKHSL